MALNFRLPIANRQLKILGDRSMSDVIRKGVRVKHINKVAILGAGTMGARIAAHFANAGVPSYLLDIVPPDADAPARNKIAAAGDHPHAGNGSRSARCGDLVLRRAVWQRRGRREGYSEFHRQPLWNVFRSQRDAAYARDGSLDRRGGRTYRAVCGMAEISYVSND